MIRLKQTQLSPVLSEEERLEIERAGALQQVFDSDCPEMSEKQLSQFKLAHHMSKQMSWESQFREKGGEQMPVQIRKTLRERAGCYDGALNLSDEADREESAGNEVW